ncbi:MAG: D-alanyl-D-alanine carboxypeptidase [Clostridia bacterium]|nr:D-alanyl-D-alanine carboxypeptidase [Clostridia bacterium]
MLRKIIILLFIIAFMFSLFSMHSMAFSLDKTEASVDSYYLFDLKNNLVMAEENSDKIISPSSSVKIMTACIILESGLDLNSEIEITEKMLLNVSGRNMELEIGNKLTANDLLYAMLCGGFNDATVALALSVSSTLYEFTNLMNAKAEALKMTSTHYANVTGMEAAAAKTIARDLSILARYMVQNEKFLEVCSTKFYRFSDNATSKYTSVNNRSTLLSTYKGLANFNTGSSKSGDCAIVYYKTDDCELISIVMNALAFEEADTSNHAEIYIKNLLSHAINDYETVTVKSAKNPITSLPVKYSITSDNIDLYLKEDIKLFLSKDIDISSDLTYNIQIYGGELKAPINEGDEVGVLTVSHNGTVLTSTPILVKVSIERNAFLFAMDVMKSFITSIWFIIILITVLLLVILARSCKKRKFRKKKRQRKNKSKIIKK